MTTSSPGEMVDLDVVRAALTGDFDIIGELGRGGMAIVFRARERELDREVALKVLPFSLAFDAGFVERFQREARTAGRLEHPHIVPIYRVGRSGCVIYFTMQLLRGQSLSERLRERGRLTATEVRRVLIETASALGYAAKHGVVHRDVKPDNILLDADDRCVVTDFGIARSASEQRLTATGMSVGTPRYMSPEQARAHELDGRSDLYSLGIVAYECLAGRAPFEDGDAFAILMAHINEPLPRPPLGTPEEHSLFAVIEKMLAKAPADRFQSADEVIAALGGASPRAGNASFAAGSGAPARRPLTPTQPALAASGWPTKPSRPAAESSSVGMPDLGKSVARARSWFDAHRPAIRRASLEARAAIGTTVSVARRVSPRVWAAGAGAFTLLIGTYYAIHFATMHRTRCPTPPPAAAVALLAEKSAESRSAAASSLVLLVDAVERRSAGSDLDVYYDVCGLDAGTSFTTIITVRRAGFALPGFRGRTVTDSYNDRADDAGTRRHRTVDFDDMPAGSYVLGVEMTDARGRSRERRVDISVTE